METTKERRKKFLESIESPPKMPQWSDVEFNVRMRKVGAFVLYEQILIADGEEIDRKPLLIPGTGESVQEIMRDYLDKNNVLITNK